MIIYVGPNDHLTPYDLLMSYFFISNSTFDIISRILAVEKYILSSLSMENLKPPSYDEFQYLEYLYSTYT